MVSAILIVQHTAPVSPADTASGQLMAVAAEEMWVAPLRVFTGRTHLTIWDTKRTWGGA